MVRRPRDADVQRVGADDRDADRSGCARRDQWRVVCSAVRTDPALRVRPHRLARRAVVRARDGDELDRRAGHVCARRRMRTRRGVRVATPASDSCSSTRVALLAVESVGRRLPRDRRGSVGLCAAGTARDRGRRACRRTRADRDSRAAVPQPGERTVRALGTHLGSRTVSDAGDRGAAGARTAMGCRVLCRRGRGIVRRAERTRRQRQPPGSVRCGPVAGVRAAARASLVARRARDPIADLAVLSRGRWHRLRAHRSFDEAVVLHTLARVPRRPARTDRARRDPLDVPALGGGVRGAPCAARAGGNGSSTLCTTRSSTPSRLPRRLTTSG